MHTEDMKSFAIEMFAALGFLLAVVPIASAYSTECSGLIPNGTVIDGNLTVPANTRCDLDDGTVNGNVRVETDAALFISVGPGQTVTINGNVRVGTGARVLIGGETITVSGNLTADQCDDVRIAFGAITVTGNFIIENCTSTTEASGYNEVTLGGNFVCSGSGGEGCVASSGVVHGNLTMDNNTGDSSVFGNQISGNVNVSGNSASVIVGSNTIDGNLRCFDNRPPPSDFGIPNTVSGHKKGQCARL
jgi:hypothetical protein